MGENNNFERDPNDKKNEEFNVNFDSFKDGTYDDIRKLETEEYWKWYRSNPQAGVNRNVQPVPPSVWGMFKKSSDSQNNENGLGKVKETSTNDLGIQEMVLEKESDSNSETESSMENYVIDSVCEAEEEQISENIAEDELLVIGKDEQTIIEEDDVRNENAVIEGGTSELNDVKENLGEAAHSDQANDKTNIVEKQLIDLLRKLVGTEVNQILLGQDIYAHFLNEYNYTEKEMSKNYIGRRMNEIAKKYNFISQRSYVQDKKKVLSTYTNFQDLLK